nr:hypothetical protein [Tanacetum cinerariifolium]
MTLRNHLTHPHCEVIKAQKNQNPESGQTSMARDGSVFRIGFKGLGGTSKMSSRYGLVGCGKGVLYEEKGVDYDFDLNDEEVVAKLDDVSLVDGVFEGAFGGDGYEDFVMGESVAVSSSSLVKSTKSFFSGMMVILILLEILEEDAWVEAMEVEENKED